MNVIPELKIIYTFKALDIDLNASILRKLHNSMSC